MKNELTKKIIIMIVALVGFACAGRLSMIDVSEFIQAGEEAWKQIERDEENVNSSGANQIDVIDSTSVQSGGVKND